MSAVGLIALLIVAARPLTWLETTYEDFRDGTITENLYVSHRDSGCVEFEWRFDLNGDSYLDLLCADAGGPYLRLYWGDSGGYSASRVRTYPISYGGGCDAADLDVDGFADLVHSGWHSGARIYWGTSSGPSPSNSQSLNANGAETVVIADLDRDGYLDIVFPGEDGPIIIYWGSASGYSTARSTQISTGYGMSHNPVVADVDKDGYRDLLVCCYENTARQPIVKFGPNRTYSLEWLDYRSGGAYGPHGVTVADLDANGWLDVVYSGYSSVTEAYVYFGSDSGFPTGARCVIDPGPCYGGSSACDVNADSLLDLVFFRGNGNFRGYFVPVAFINTGEWPYFSMSDTMRIGRWPQALSGGMLADIDLDGHLDCFLNSYDPYEPDPKPSLVLYGPSLTRSDTLPCEVDHHAMFREPGSVYDRDYRESYLSSVFDAGSTARWLRVRWQATSPAGSAVSFDVRTGDTPSPDSGWTGWVHATPGGTLPDSLASRYIQYRADLSYLSPGALPRLDEVSIDYGSTSGPDVGVEAVLAPAGQLDSGDLVTPVAVARNHGSTAAVFPVTMTIGVGYRQTLTDSLEAGQVDTLEFPVWAAVPSGPTEAVCWTELVGDIFRGNDTARAAVQVRAPVVDISVLSILEPRTDVDSGRTVVPTATVANLGSRRVVCPVYFTIPGQYSGSDTVDLDPGELDTVMFNPWVPTSLGDREAYCYVTAAGDTNRHNDTARVQFRVISAPIRDVRVNAILAPLGVVDSGWITIPVAIVDNRSTEAAQFPVTMRIGASYRDSVIVVLPARSIDTISFAAWQATVQGRLPVICHTALPGDEQPHNDTLVDSITVVVVRHDIGAVAVLRPVGRLTSGIHVRPAARVRNFGTLPEQQFPVEMRIGTGYRQRLVFFGPLDPGSETTVEFPEWQVTEGVSLVTCSTGLSGDCNASNNRVDTNCLGTAQLTLTLGDDQTDRIRYGQTKAYRFFATLGGDGQAAVELLPPTPDPGWHVDLRDVDNEALTDSDHDGWPELGVLGSGDTALFDVWVSAIRSPSGDTGCYGAQLLVTKGRLDQDTLVTDDVSLELEPEFTLHIHNFPNPFAARTTFVLSLPTRGQVDLTVYTRNGEKVRRVLSREWFDAGVWREPWDGLNDAGGAVADGAYEYLLVFRHSGVTDHVRKRLVRAGD